MKNVIKNSAVAAILTAAAIFGSCSHDDDPDITPQAVRFTSSINEASHTLKASGASWAANDAVGIYMLATTPANNAENKRHVTATGSSAFAAVAGQEIYYPQNGEDVDFVAYYPYKDNIGGMNYPVNVATQTDQSAIDLLYSNNAVGKNKTDGDVALYFTHKLSKIVVNTVNGDGFGSPNFGPMTMKIRGMNTTATFDLRTGTLGDGGNPAPITPLPVGIGGERYEAIVLPATFAAEGDMTMEFELNNAKGEVLTWKCPAGESFEAGKQYTYRMTISRTRVIATCTITDWNDVERTGTAERADTESEIPVIEKVWIPAGTFLMGSPETEPNRFTDSETQHSVTLTQGFHMSKNEITNTQYAAFLNAKRVSATSAYGSGSFVSGSNPVAICSWGENNGKHLLYDISNNSSHRNQNWGVKWDVANEEWTPVPGCENHPVIWVSWFGAVEFARWVGGSLPTEAQWEYACRGGQSESLPFGIGNGKIMNGEMANVNGQYIYDMDNGGYIDLDEFGGIFMNKTMPVGSYPESVNGYGLYDMHGNVLEWCSDFYDPDYGSENASDSVTDPTVLSSIGGRKVVRGGGWHNNSSYSRSAYRWYYGFYDANPYVGFRVVFTQ